MICGIDPGMTGGISFIDKDGNTFSYVMPMKDDGTGLDYDSISNLLEWHKPDHVFIEKVHAMPKQGVVSMFNFGRYFEGVIACVSTLQYPCTLVPPKQWQKILDKTPEQPTKEAALAFVNKQYPDATIIMKRCRKPHSGIVDALCIAHYGVTTLG